MFWGGKPKQTNFFFPFGIKFIYLTAMQLLTFLQMFYFFFLRTCPSVNRDTSVSSWHDKRTSTSVKDDSIFEGSSVYFYTPAACSKILHNEFCVLQEGFSIVNRKLGMETTKLKSYWKFFLSPPPPLPPSLTILLKANIILLYTS